MKPETVKYPIPSDILTATIEAMRDYSRLLEAEAAALIGTARHEQDEVLIQLGRKLGRKRLEQADQAAELFEFYLNL